MVGHHNGAYHLALARLRLEIRDLLGHQFAYARQLYKRALTVAADRPQERIAVFGANDNMVGCVGGIIPAFKTEVFSCWCGIHGSEYIACGCVLVVIIVFQIRIPLKVMRSCRSASICRGYRRDRASDARPYVHLRIKDRQ